MYSSKCSSAGRNFHPYVSKKQMKVKSKGGTGVKRSKSVEEVVCRDVQGTCRLDQGGLLRKGKLPRENGWEKDNDTWPAVQRTKARRRAA